MESVPWHGATPQHPAPRGEQRKPRPAGLRLSEQGLKTETGLRPLLEAGIGECAIPLFRVHTESSPQPLRTRGEIIL